MLGFSPLSTTPLASKAGQYSAAGNASGSLSAIYLTAPNGTASISGAITAFASGSIRPIYLTAPRGSATPGQITYARAPSGSGYAPRVEYSFRPEQINTTRH